MLFVLIFQYFIGYAPDKFFQLFRVVDFGIAACLCDDLRRFIFGNIVQFKHC